MTKSSVLAIGIEPASADISAYPHVSFDLVRSYINAQIERLRALGFDVTSCLIDLDGGVEQQVTQALAARPFDCIVIGAGLRQPPAQLLLFERVINLIHVLAPQARICFNTNPGDTAEAVMRWVEP